MTASTTASRKAKARQFQQRIRDDIITKLGLNESDVRSTSMGAPGCDILLSSAALKQFPFCIECKRQESIRLSSWWQQCEANAKKSGLKPLLVFRWNRGPTLVVLRWNDFLDLLP